MLDGRKLVGHFLIIRGEVIAVRLPSCRRRARRRQVEEVLDRFERRGGFPLRAARELGSEGSCRRALLSRNERPRQSKLRRIHRGLRRCRSAMRNEWTKGRLCHYKPSQLYLPTSGTNRTGAISTCSSLSPCRVNMYKVCSSRSPSGIRIRPPSVS